MERRKGKVIKKLKEIMDLSLPYCKHDDEELSSIFYKINNLAHDAENYVRKLDVNQG